MSATADDAMVQDDEESSDGESDFEEIEAEEEDMAAITQLEEELQGNPNLYDKHVEYLSLLRKCKMKTRLRTARQMMHDRFPLSEALWLEWLTDEEDSLKTAEDVEELEKLFETAVEDYLSTTIWLKYLILVMETDEEVKSGSKAGKEKMRAVYERALAAGGLHVTEGGRLWQACRKYEAQHAADSNPKDADNPVVKLFMRQLQVPLQDGPDTLKEWCELSGSGLTDATAMQNSLPGNVKAAYAKAQAAVQARIPYEESVALSKPADLDLLAAFAAYIKLEQASGEPARVQCIFERALAKFPVTHMLWLQYGHYLEQHLNVLAIVRHVYARSLRALERAGAPDAEHEELYNAALSAGMETAEDYMDVSLARLDALRRQGPNKMEALRAAFTSVSEMMQTYFPDYVDRSVRMPAYWATCELEIARDYGEGRKVWEEALRSPLGMHAEAVAAYVAFELSAKHVREARSVFRKYHRRKMHESGGVAICEAWLRFEREHGSAEDLFQALVKAEPVLLEAASAATEAAQPELAAEAKAAAQKGPQLSKAEAKRLRQEKDPNFKKTDKLDRLQGGNQKRKKGLGFQDDKDAKRAKPADEKAPGPRSAQFQSTATQDVDAVEAPEGSLTAAGEEAEPSMSLATSSGQKQMPPPAAPSRGGVHEQQVVGEHQRTAFVRGILPDANRDEVQALFAPCGQIVELSMPEDRSSKAPTNRPLQGFAYVTFSSPEGLRRAVALGAPEVRGKELSVRVAHREVQADQRTAFVLNVDPRTTCEALEALLGSCGVVKSVRLPLDRHTSQPRGFAYVEFETSAALQQAVDMTGIELCGRNLRVSVANTTERSGPQGAGRGPGRGGPRARGGRGPPQRFPPRQGGFENGGRGGGFEGQAPGGGRAGRTHLDVKGQGGNPFRPRAVQRGGGSAPRTNDDFRAMLKK